MNNNTKRVIKNGARTGGKYALKGIKFAGLGVLSTTELASKGIRKVAGSKKARNLLAKGLVIGASVAFPAPIIMMTGINYMFQSSCLGKNISPVDALLETSGTLTKVLDSVLDVAAVPTTLVAKGVETVSKKGKDAIEGSR